MQAAQNGMRIWRIFGATDAAASKQYAPLIPTAESLQPRMARR